MAAPTSKPPIYIFDGTSYIYRAFFAIRGLSTSTGIPTGATFGVTNMLYKVLSEKQPDYVAMVFDARGETFRHRQYEFYKANRPPMPDDMRPQVAYIKKIVEAFRLPTFEVEGFEADDVIATLTRRAREEGYPVIIVSGDKDLLQLVGEGVSVWDPMKDAHYGPAEIRERFGLEPRQLADVMALVGDAIDNVPGVPGVGEKTALPLIQRFGSVEALLASLEEVDKPRLRELLARHAEEARRSKELVLLDEAVPLEVDIPSLARRPFDTGRLKELFRELEFHRLLEELTPAARFERGVQRLITTQPELEALAARLAGSAEVVVEPHLCCDRVCPSPVMARLCGLTLASPEESAYVALGEHPGGRGLEPAQALATLAPLLEDQKQSKVLPSLKTAAIALAAHGLRLGGEVFDLGLASYLVNPEAHDHSLESIARERLDRRLGPEENNRSRKATPPTLEEEAERFCGRAQAALLCAPPLRRELAKANLEPLLRELEQPLALVLADMETCGVKVDTAALGEIAREFEEEMKRREADVFRLAGEEFNINSPKQLGRILFEKLRLPLGKRTAKRTGWSTDIEVLGQLALLHPLPKEVIEYRIISKLKGTYVDALPRLINPATGRIHTSYNQTVAATGRLSSSDPNLQNIPVRGELGQRIRRTFIAEDGWRLLSADYSQIELRLLAHLSGDAALAEAFREGRDIHTLTAAGAFGVHPELVTPEMRRQAKVINFGIIYGMSAFGLAKELGIGRREAQKYIDRYFARYPGVRRFWEGTLAQARERGWVETILGRRRYVPALASHTPHIRALAERTAINAPLQGSAADIIKKAMIELHRAMKDRKMRSRLILQVHDELVLEVPEAELEAAKGLVREKMTQAVKLSVPLEVNMASGHSWAEAH